MEGMTEEEIFDLVRRNYCEVNKDYIAEQIAKAKIANCETCGECYWFCDTPTKVCDHEHDPTTEESKACEFFEPKEDIHESYF